MNAFTKMLSTILLNCLWVMPVSAAAESAPPKGPSGHWEGAINLPGTRLDIRVDLRPSSSKGWEGTIDIPVQGLRGLKLERVNVSGADITFIMPGIPGEPAFNGKLGSDQQSLSGYFTQSGQQFPFKLERKQGKPPAAGETPAKGIPGRGLAGFWQGSLKPSPIIDLRLSLELTNSSSGSVSGVMVSLDQGAARIPITSVTSSNGTVRFETKSVGGVFEGKLRDDGSEMEGEWSQGGTKLPLVFRRLPKAAQLNRPQEPVRPFAYLEREVVVENTKAGVKLAGTLTLPRGQGPFPGVILISGSGAQDRDEAVMGHRPFLVLGDYLTRQGIAVLRYDDRGTAQSTGNFSTATKEDFVQDALAAFWYLRSLPEIACGRVGLLGHSEGGIVAPIAAVRQPLIAFLVLLAGIGVPTEDLLVQQGKDIARTLGAGEDTIAGNAALQQQIFRILREEADSAIAQSRIRAALSGSLETLSESHREISKAAIESQVRMTTSPWFRDFIDYDPRPTLRRVDCPVLALNGEKDLQVSAQENLAAIKSELIAGGNTNVLTMELPGLNHLFQTAQTGAVSEYGTIEETFNPAALKLIAEWIHKITTGDAN